MIQIIASIALDRHLTPALMDVSAYEITDDARLRDDYDLDSMGSFNLASAIHKRLGVNIPESDFARLQSLAQLVAYLEKRPA